MSLCILPEKPFPSPPSFYLSTFFPFDVVVAVFAVANDESSCTRHDFWPPFLRGNCTLAVCNQSERLSDRVNDMYAARVSGLRPDLSLTSSTGARAKLVDCDRTAGKRICVYVTNIIAFEKRQPDQLNRTTMSLRITDEPGYLECRLV